MNTRPILTKVLAAVLLAFGLLTLFLSSSVLLDLFGIRERESPYVPEVVWANLFASLLYLVSAAGALLKRTWAPRPLSVAVAVLLLGAVFLVLHINDGEAYRTATIGALAFRTLLTFAFFFALRWTAVHTVPNTEP